MFGRVVGVIAASLNLLVQLAYLNHDTFWSFTVILIDVPSVRAFRLLLGPDQHSPTVVSSGDQVVSEDDLDESDDGADDHAEQSVQEEGRHERVLEDLGVVDRVQHRLFDLQRQQ